MDRLEISPCVSVEFLCGGSFKKAVLSENMVRVLREIDSSGSINKAAKRLHMSYSNTLRTIAAIEEALGVSLVKRPQGPSGSSLTDDCRFLIGIFEHAQKEIQQYAATIVLDRKEEVMN